MTINRDLGNRMRAARWVRRLLFAPFVVAVNLMVMAALAQLALYPVLETRANAGVEGMMNDYFDEMGAAANITGPTAYQGQSGGYYSAGNVYVRFPQKSLNLGELYKLQMPNVRAGCGGIDIFTGSFSFINAGEVVALLKATANNALGFAFQLAIDTLCPECGKVMEQMRAASQLMNQQMMNSCEMAQSLVGGVWPKTDAASRAVCESIATNDGKYPDWARARHGCGVENGRAATVNSASPEYDDVNPGVPRNFTWEALKKSPFFAPGGSIDQPLAEYVMTMVGTVIVVPADDSSPGSYTPYKGDTTSTLVSALLDGTGSTTVTVLACDEPVRCINPVTETRTVSASAALRPKIRSHVISMMSKILSDTALSSEEQGVLQTASLPLYKILTVRAAYSRGAAVGDIDSVVEVTAVDMLYAILDQIMTQVSNTKATFQAGEQSTVEEWSRSLDQVREGLHNRHAVTNQRAGLVMAYVENTAQMERTIQANLSPSLAASLDWSRAVTGRGTL